jgi:hypothetical protein
MWKWRTKNQTSLSPTPLRQGVVSYIYRQDGEHYREFAANHSPGPVSKEINKNDNFLAPILNFVLFLWSRGMTPHEAPLLRPHSKDTVPKIGDKYSQK